MQKSHRSAQARRELDRRFAAANLEPLDARPRGGWISAIRAGLGMSQQALAVRLGVSKATVAKLERSERLSTISLGRLADVARAMDCHLVYALVPNETLEVTVQRQAERVAAQTVGYAAVTMALEDQGIDAGHLAESIEAHARVVLEANRQWSLE